MPIGRDEWDAGRTWETLEARILEFLRKNRDKAFSFEEIFQAVGYKMRTEDVGSFISSLVPVLLVQEALKTLVKEGTVKARTVRKAIGGETYYMAS